MPGTTPIYSLPYPVSSDLVSAYPALGQDLAEDLDDILAAKWTTDTAWTAYTPTVRAESGTPTTVTATGRYVKIGKIVHLYVQISVVNKGTASAGMIFTLPVLRNSTPKEQAISGVESAAIGLGLAGWTGGGFPGDDEGMIFSYNWGTLWTNGLVLNVNTTYEAA